MSVTSLAAVIAVVLLALLVGVAVPVLLELRATLRSTRARIEATATRADAALHQLASAAERLNRLGAVAEGEAERARHVLQTAERVAHTIDRLHGSIQLATSLGPAVIAAAKAVFAAFRGRDDEPPSSADETAAQTEPDGTASEEEHSREAERRLA